MNKLACVVVIAGCGSSGGTPVDATIDTTIGDAAPDAAAMGLVSVTVVNGTTPYAGATVFFADASGHVLTSSTTGADGKASATVAAGSSVTCEITTGAPGSIQHALESVFDVQPGDALVLGNLGSANPTAVAEGSVQISFPSAYGGANDYLTAMGSCGSSGGTSAAETALLDSACLSSGGTFDVLALAKDNATNTMLAYSTDLGLTPAGAGNTAMVTMPSWRTDFGTHAVTITNAAPNATIVSQFHLDHDSVVFTAIPSVTTTTTTGGGGVLSIPYPKSIGTSVDYTITANYPTNIGGVVSQSYLVREPIGNLQNETFDLGTMPQFLGREIYVPQGKTTPLLSWVTTAPLASATGGISLVYWSTPTEGWMWYGVLPASTASSVQFPDLPDALAADRTSPGQAFTAGTVVFVQGTMYADSAAFRANWFAVLNPTTGTYAERASGIQ